MLSINAVAYISATIKPFYKLHTKYDLLEENGMMFLLLITNCCILITMSKIHNQIQKLDIFGKMLAKTKAQKIVN